MPNRPKPAFMASWSKPTEKSKSTSTVASASSALALPVACTRYWSCVAPKPVMAPSAALAVVGTASTILPSRLALAKASVAPAAVASAWVVCSFQRTG